MIRSDRLNSHYRGVPRSAPGRPCRPGARRRLGAALQPPAIPSGPTRSMADLSEPWRSGRAPRSRARRGLSMGDTGICRRVFRLTRAGRARRSGRCRAGNARGYEFFETVARAAWMRIWRRSDRPRKRGQSFCCGGTCRSILIRLAHKSLDLPPLSRDGPVARRASRRSWRRMLDVDRAATTCFGHGCARTSRPVAAGASWSCSRPRLVRNFYKVMTPPAIAAAAG